MSENKRYYWLKLNENFFEDDTIAWLEEQKNGKDYVIFYLKLCLKSLKDDGSLIRYVGQTLIPYDVPALAKLTSTNEDTVAVAMKTFVEIGLIEIKETGEIYLSQINELIGSETDSAKRMRKKRAKEDNQKKLPASQCDNNVQKSDRDVQKSDTEIELEKDIEIDKEQKKSKKEQQKKLEEDFEKLWKLYPNKKGKSRALEAYAKALKDGVTNKEIQDGILAYKKEVQLKGTQPQYIAHGSTWFNQRRWEDEYSTAGRVVSDAFVEDAPTNPDEVEYSDEDRYWYEKYMKEHGG